jgi:hypothetical protein
VADRGRLIVGWAEPVPLVKAQGRRDARQFVLGQAASGPGEAGNLDVRRLVIVRDPDEHAALPYEQRRRQAQQQQDPGREGHLPAGVVRELEVRELPDPSKVMLPVPFGRVMVCPTANAFASGAPSTCTCCSRVLSREYTDCGRPLLRPRSPV